MNPDWTKGILFGKEVPDNYNVYPLWAVFNLPGGGIEGASSNVKIRNSALTHKVFNAFYVNSSQFVLQISRDSPFTETYLKLDISNHTSPLFIN